MNNDKKQEFLSDEQLSQVTGGMCEGGGSLEDCEAAFRQCKSQHGGQSQKCLMEYQRCKGSLQAPKSH